MYVEVMGDGLAVMKRCGGQKSVGFITRDVRGVKKLARSYLPQITDFKPFPDADVLDAPRNRDLY
jgi:hypothetical protein